MYKKKVPRPVRGKLFSDYNVRPSSNFLVHFSSGFRSRKDSQGGNVPKILSQSTAIQGENTKKGRPSVKIKSAPAPFREKRFYELFSKASSVRSKIASSPSLSQRKSKKSSLISLSTMLRSIFTSSSWFVHQLTTISKSFSLSVKWAYLTKKENHELLIPQHPFVDWHHVTCTTNLPEGIKFPFGLCLLSCISGGEEGGTRKWRRTRRITREDIHPTLNTITGSFLLALPLAM